MTVLSANLTIRRDLHYFKANIKVFLSKKIMWPVVYHLRTIGLGSRQWRHQFIWPVACLSTWIAIFFFFSFLYLLFIRFSFFPSNFCRISSVSWVLPILFVYAGRPMYRLQPDARVSILPGIKSLALPDWRFSFEPNCGPSFVSIALQGDSCSVATWRSNLEQGSGPHEATSCVDCGEFVVALWARHTGWGQCRVSNLMTRLT